MPYKGILALGALALGCGAQEPEPVAESLQARAEQLAHEILIIDTHVDVPYRLNKQNVDISARTEGGDFDYPRAVAGGLDAPFMSIYVPASYQKTGGAKDLADRLIDMVEGFEQQWPDKFAVARSVADVRRHFEEGKMSLPMGMENGAPIESNLANLQHFYERGIRYITLTHSENNQICDSSYATERDWQGLSPFGREVVAEMNRLGIMIDISHVSDAALAQVLEISQAPVIASHSSCRRFTPGFERNMNDEMIRQLGEHGGVIHINFGSPFLTEESNRRSLKMWIAFRSFLEEHGLAQDDPEAMAHLEELLEEYPPILADVTDVADHIDHVVQLAGVDHVGLGSDFDGSPRFYFPMGLRDVGDFPQITLELLRRGYNEMQIRMILGENLLRVLEATEQARAET